MQITQIMSKFPASVTPDAFLQSVAQMMIDKDCGAIPVCEENTARPIGMVTDRDIVVRLVAKGINPLDTRVRDVMSKRCVCVHENATVDQAVKLMEENAIRRIPVVDDNSNLIGIVAQADIARYESDRETGEVVRDISKAPRSA